MGRDAAVALVTLVFGDMLPTTIALGHANTIAIRSARWVSQPGDGARAGVEAAALGQPLFCRAFVGRRQSSMVTEEEIKMLVDAGQEGGAIEDEEKK
jgi:CBS domain containing-hemolysin-like protein